MLIDTSITSRGYSYIGGFCASEADGRDSGLNLTDSVIEDQDGAIQFILMCLVFCIVCKLALEKKENSKMNSNQGLNNDNLHQNKQLVLKYMNFFEEQCSLAIIFQDVY